MYPTVFYDRFLFSERCAWAMQNAVGAILPMLFVVVDRLRFTGACTAILFYGVSSQAFSIDRSIGGRMFGALLWTGAFLMGGTLAFAMTWLAWLARGAGVVGVLTVSESEQSALPTVSASYYILVMVLHVVCSFYMSRPRAMEADFMCTARGTLSHVYLSVVTTMAVLMPLLGPEQYWTQNIGAMMKAITITMAGAILGPLLVCVQSSHDNVRRRLGACMMDAGLFLTDIASGGRGDGRAVGGGASRHGRTVQDLIRQTALIEMDLMCCTLEPPWPMLTSQVGADFRKYGASLLQLQKLLGSTNALFNCVGDGNEDVKSVVQQCVVGVATSLASMAVCLGHMPLAAACSGNKVAWRPFGEPFWGRYEALIEEGYLLYLSTNGLHKGACQGIADVLAGEDNGHTRTSPMVSLTSCETLVRECKALEDWVSRALDIDGGVVGASTADEGAISDAALAKERPGADDDIDGRNALYRIAGKFQATISGPYAIALVNDLLQATSYSTWVLQITRFWQTTVSVVSCRWLRMDGIQYLLARRDIQFYLKFFCAVNSALVAIVLVEWLGYGNSDSAAGNATSMATFYSNWQPEYFLTATVICMQKTVEISVVKALLRTTLIAVGGALGFASMLSGTLASNPYFVFFIVIIVNGFFGLFSVYGMDFRYSLFLLVYTFNGVVACQYTGACCQSGNVLEFGGKAVSTCLGAVWAMIWSILIVPMYTSEVVLGLEKNFLCRSFGHLNDSWQRLESLMDASSTLLSPKEVESIELGKVATSEAVSTSNLRVQLLADVDDITKLRIDSFKAFAKEITLNSLDKRELHFVKLNLVPLPRSVHLIVRDLAILGSMISASCKSLYLGLAQAESSHGQLKSTLCNVLSEVRPSTNDLLDASDRLRDAIGKFFAEQRSRELAFHRNAVDQSVAAVQSARMALAATFADAKVKIASRDASTSTLKILAYYAFLLRALCRLEALGTAIVHDDGYAARNGWSSFWTSWHHGNA